MWFLLLGLVLLALKFAGIAPVETWDGWLLCIPFALAAAWWAWADASGLTQRKAMQAMDEKKAQRRARAMQALGQIDPKSKSKKKP